MNTDIRAALAPTADDIPAGPLSEHDLRQQWDEQADKFNQWDSLESSEQLAWAQARAVVVDRNRRDALAQPGGKDPTDDEILAALRPLYGDQSAADMGAEDDLIAARAVLARWGRPAAAPVAPEVGPAMADLENLELAFEQNFGSKVRPSRIRPVLLHYATLLQQQAAKIAELEAAAPPPLPPDYIDPEHTGWDLGVLETFYRACQSEGGTTDEVNLRGIRAVLAARPVTPPALGPKNDWFAVAIVAQDMRSRGLAEQMAGDELLKLANSNRSRNAIPLAPVPGEVPVSDDRNPECVARWPECVPDGYNPRCCRFPKSCSCWSGVTPQAGEVQA